MIQQFDKFGTLIREWEEALNEVARQTGIDPGSISRAIRGHRSTAGGYVWKKVVLSMGTNSQDLENKRSIEQTDDTTVETFYTPNLAVTFEDAVKLSNVDQEKWKPTKWISNYWGKFSQVKIWWELKQQAVSNDFLLEVEDRIRKWGKQPIQYKNNNGRIGVALTSDFHLGAEVKNLIRTPNYSTDILIDKLDKVAKEINSYNLKEVHYCFLGDFWESLSGLNHLSTFKSLESGMWGNNAIVYGHKIMSTFLSKIQNLSSISIITGNHDRFSNNKEIENTGEAGKTLAYLLSLTFPNLPIDCNDLLLTKRFDGINYLLSHGDKNLNNKEVSKVIFDFGDNEVFNVFVEGHKHTRIGKKYNKLSYYEEYEFVSLDELKYRKITLPAIFSGNYYSEQLGLGGNSGFMLSINNGNGIPNIHDLSV